MKVKTINRSEEAATRERAQDVQKVRPLAERCGQQARRHAGAAASTGWLLFCSAWSLGCTPTHPRTTACIAGAPQPGPLAAPV